MAMLTDVGCADVDKSNTNDKTVIGVLPLEFIQPAGSWHFVILERKIDKDLKPIKRHSEFCVSF